MTEATEERALRVAIADDAMLLREGIAKVLEEGGVEVVASVGTADELLAAIPDLRPDVAVLDIRMPPTHRDEGIVALERIRQNGDELGVLLLSMYATPEYALRVMGAGSGTGYLLKERVSEPQTLVRAVQTVASGGSVVDPEVVEQLVQRTRADDPLARLTERERSVLELMAQGYSNGGIAQTLFLGLKTVETHVRSILQKLDLEESPEHHRRVLAVLTLLGQR
ncbi:response regulator [Agromyces marinus]|uniref:Two-component system response regulator, LuxR family protein n=1 Tax=Agromyces marinus TaxID=1389020 RepID=A0ABN6YE05_9MICO|nr:response regulator transcription factor [Agromyces marinus]UIP59349.1 Oxygen regulatory protein NreC [Agromyces marinus]BDZ55619.1 putative two-component system response regulator, LuxR family protein [Agromyces marinus]